MFCQNCGKKFESKNKMQRYCPDCQAQKKEEQKEKQKGYAKARAERLNLVNITIYKSDKDYIAKIAKEKGVTMAEIIKEIIKRQNKE